MQDALYSTPANQNVTIAVLGASIRRTRHAKQMLV
jgi:hypothetical protein